MKFGEILRKMRIEKDWTQKELGAKLNVTDTAVRCWELFGREPNYDTLIKIAEIFEVTVGQLLGTEDY